MRRLLSHRVVWYLAAAAVGSAGQLALAALLRDLPVTIPIAAAQLGFNLLVATVAAFAVRWVIIEHVVPPLFEDPKRVRAWMILIPGLVLAIADVAYRSLSPLPFSTPAWDRAAVVFAIPTVMCAWHYRRLVQAFRT